MDQLLRAEPSDTEEHATRAACVDEEGTGGVSTLEKFEGNLARVHLHA